MTMVLEKAKVTTDTFHIVIADDQPSVGAMLRQAVAVAVQGARLTEAVDLPALAALIRGRAVDLVLLDLAMPGIGGLPGLLFLRSQHPDVPMIVVSATQDPAAVRRCMDAGAAGYIPACAEVGTMREAIRTVIAGESWIPPNALEAPAPAAEVAEATRRLANLTPQQLRVLTLLARGLLNKQIAYELTVSEATVKAHVSAILQKLDVDTRTQAVGVVTMIEGHPVGRRDD